MLAQDAGANAPDAWTVARAVFLPKFMSPDIEAQRPSEPSAPLVAWALRGLQCEYEDQLNPCVLCAERRVRGCSVGAHILVNCLVARHASEWVGKRVGLLAADLSGALGPMRYHLIWRPLRHRLGAAAVQAFMKASIGQDIMPRWTGMAGDRAPTHKGCKQDAPESPALRKPWAESCGSGRRGGVASTSLP